MHRLGQEGDVREAHIFALELWVVFGPEFDERLQVFVGYSAALGEGGRVQEFKLFFHPADASAQDQAALG